MSGGVLPLWVLIPPAACMMIVLAGYVHALRESDVPESRRRIRTASSLVMMLLQPLLVYIFGIGGMHQPRPFVFTVALVLGLVSLLVMLAIIDALNNVKLNAQQRANWRREIRQMREEIEQLRRDARASDRPDLRLVGNDDRLDG